MDARNVSYSDEIEVYLRPPTWTRFLKLFFLKNEFSILRSLEYEILTENQISGQILDIGGGVATDYYKRIEEWAKADIKCKYESVNIDQAAKSTYVVEPGRSWPVSSDTYDTVMSLNTFEHIYDLQQVLSEIYRILTSQGCLLFTVPFVFRVHGCPNDYIRGTPSFWHNILVENRFENIEIEAINWGPFSTGLTVSGVPGPFKSIRRNFAIIMDIIYFQMRYAKQDKIHWKQNHQICNAPLGYFISARKI